jgi:LacI family transcriptional regulator
MPSLEALREAGVPMVAIDRVPTHHAGPKVTLNNLKAGCLAAEHLLSLGHTRVAHISGPLSLSLARDRLAGFVDTFKQHGLPDAASATREGNWECADGHQAMSDILSSGSWPTAVFCANDRMAMGAMRAIIEAGLRVPEDISVMGLDDIEFAAFQTPPLTTVRQSFTDMATLGVQLLLDVIEGHQSPNTNIVLEPELIVRQSTARVGKA